MSLKFKRTKEDFKCENCLEEVSGDGYTNHCPHCLWSKHVDIFPGDRLEGCGGMMEPVGLEQKSGEFVVIQKCQKCGKENKNKISDKDNLPKLIQVIKEKNK